MKLSDKDVEQVLQELKNNDEQALAHAIIAILKLEFNNRQFLRKIWKHLQNVHMEKTQISTKKLCDCISNIQIDPLKLKDNDILIG